ncbi:MAG: hypothetical protein E7451_03360 [Ruminococcaceae bacterium]|nr:hypothetical protein [Oscillospiraceae bacterium]
MRFWAPTTVPWAWKSNWRINLFMKPFAKRLLALASAAAITLGTIPAVHAVYRQETDYKGVADWALLEVTAMDQLGLIPEQLRSADMTTDITRQEMCSLAVATYEQVTGSEVTLTEADPFLDTTDTDVAKAREIGIVQGDGNGLFRPDDSLTRVEFFTFVGRYLAASGMELTEESYGDLAAYSDAASLPAWAKEPTALTVGLEVVKGSGTTLDWQRVTSCQEALAMFYRARNASMDYKPADEFVELSGWAEPTVLRMDQLGLIPETVKAAPMSGTITRQDLCKMVMRSYKLLTGTTDADLGEPEKLFTDTDDVDVLNAYALGIINGRGAGIFDPGSPITRQDFFTISANFLRAVDYWYIDDIRVDLSTYPDGDQFAAYAKYPAQVMVCIGAVQGDDTGALNPTRQIVSQEAVTIFSRIIDFYADWELDPVEPQPYLGDEVADFALDYVGCRYVSGGQGPKKFDCSGLVYYVYKNFGYKLEPGARNQWSILGRSVKKADLLPGDLLFFSNNGKASGIFHVGIYIGDGEFVHAANSRKGVIVTDLSDDWYADRYLGAKRAIK